MITFKKLASLKPKAKRYSLSIGDGLTVRVHPTGRKVYLARLWQGGKVRDVTLGSITEISVNDAKRQARALMNECAHRECHTTVSDAFRLWVQFKKGRIASFENERLRLYQHLIQHIEHLPLNRMTPTVVRHTLEPLARAGKTATLRRVLIYCREMLDLAVFSGLLASNPIQNLIKLYPAKPPIPMHSVPYGDLPRVMGVLATLSYRHRLLFLWTLTTLLRPGEAVACRKDWVNNGVLTVPAPYMKRRKAHRVPLSENHLALIEAIKASTPKRRSPYLFPGHNGHLNRQTLAKAIASTPLKGELVAHGLRSMGRLWLADQGVPFEIGEACLAHDVLTPTARAYLRSDYLSQREPLMRRWSQYVFDCARCAGFLPENPRLLGAIEQESAHFGACAGTIKNPLR